MFKDYVSNSPLNGLWRQVFLIYCWIKIKIWSINLSKRWKENEGNNAGKSYPVKLVLLLCHKCKTLWLNEFVESGLKHHNHNPNLWKSFFFFFFFILIMKWKFKQWWFCNSTNINRTSNHLIKYSSAKVHLDMTSNLVLAIFRGGGGAYCIVTGDFNQIAKLHNLL